VQCLKVDIVTDVIKPEQSRLIDEALQVCETARKQLDEYSNDDSATVEQ